MTTQKNYIQHYFVLMVNTAIKMLSRQDYVVSCGQQSIVVGNADRDCQH